MANVTEISSFVLSFLSGRISLDELEDWVAEYSWNIHKRANSDTQRLAYFVQARIEDFGDGIVDEAAFRQELAAAIRPFEYGLLASAVVSYQKPRVEPMVMSFGKPPTNHWVLPNCQSIEMRLYG